MNLRSDAELVKSPVDDHVEFPAKPKDRPLLEALLCWLREAAIAAFSSSSSETCLLLLLEGETLMIAGSILSLFRSKTSGISCSVETFSLIWSDTLGAPFLLTNPIIEMTKCKIYNSKDLFTEPQSPIQRIFRTDIILNNLTRRAKFKFKQI